MAWTTPTHKVIFTVLECLKKVVSMDIFHKSSAAEPNEGFMSL